VKCEIDGYWKRREGTKGFFGLEEQRTLKGFVCIWKLKFIV